MTQINMKTIVCHPDLVGTMEAVVRVLGKEGEIRVVPNPIVPNKTTAYLVVLEPILKDDK